MNEHFKKTIVVVVGILVIVLLFVGYKYDNKKQNTIEIERYSGIENNQFVTSKSSVTEAQALSDLTQLGQMSEFGLRNLTTTTIAGINIVLQDLKEIKEELKSQRELIETLKLQQNN